jgi:hypothetical protein
MKKKTVHTLVLLTLLISPALFLADGVDAQPVQSLEPPRDPNAYSPTALPAAPSVFRLIGTVEGKAFAGAVLDDATGAQSFYRINDKLPDGSQVVKVQSDSISLKRDDGTAYELYITHDTKTVVPTKLPVSAGPVTPISSVDRRLADAQRSIARQHRAYPAGGQAPGSVPGAGLTARGTGKVQRGLRQRGHAPQPQ